MQCTKISPEFECQGKGQRSRSPGTKKRKTAESSPLTMHSRACAVAGRTQQAATDDTIAWPPVGDGLRRWENQRILCSYCKKKLQRLKRFLRITVATWLPEIVNFPTYLKGFKQMK